MQHHRTVAILAAMAFLAACHGGAAAKASAGTSDKANNVQAYVDRAESEGARARSAAVAKQGGAASAPAADLPR